MSRWLGRSPLDRLPIGRGAAEVEALWRGAVVVEVDAQGAIASEQGRPRALRSPGERQPEDILLGIVDGVAWFARGVDAVSGEAMSWRDTHPDSLDPLATGVALARWHAGQPPCENCGSGTRPDQAGARRICTGCGALQFPRIDPCVIVAVTDPDDRLLLARQAQWAHGRISVIAGFIEAGESVEQAVHREVHEEVGARLTSLTYFGSEPWPMPRSLMLGFQARAEDAQITVDGDEISEGAYYTRSDLAAALAAGEVILPAGASLARALIQRWLSSG
ncbi:NAD(+) diphosphatase [Tessaracoccus sp. MC1865]|uniref:NAD(+) diphosphatase n=1 Tax=Tessaracoccus sp. MC1865 TaxID=2760310 RepID=UPI001600D3BF|nr:NAD(+) diphosphatase [Tessaracoccus sp. MC1865]MBB1483341.1 NAD(+) diphosphatase [Tessaracoccus sp. MC1865]QTO36457.1 NAD(+) diphosphatase [Tessaracoccus sp. MC1865]